MKNYKLDSSINVSSAAGILIVAALSAFVAWYSFFSAEQITKDFYRFYDSQELKILHQIKPVNNLKVNNLK
jgi:hypothetical protein